MIQSRRALTIVLSSISLCTGLLTICLLSSRSISWGSWLGLAAGSTVGIVGCLTLEKRFRNKKAENSPTVQVNQNENVTISSSRWMIPAVVGGMLLAKFVANVFSPEIQDLINNFIFAWIIVTFGYGAFLIWRIVPA